MQSATYINFPGDQSGNITCFIVLALPAAATKATVAVFAIVTAVIEPDIPAYSYIKNKNFKHDT